MSRLKPGDVVEFWLEGEPFSDEYTKCKSRWQVGEIDDVMFQVALVIPWHTGIGILKNLGALTFVADSHAEYIQLLVKRKKLQQVIDRKNARAHEYVKERMSKCVD